MKKCISAAVPFMAVMFFSLLFFSSCRKDISGGGSNNQSYYYMRFKANGVLTEYTGSTIATFTNYAPGLFSCALVGSKTAGSSTDGMAISLNDTTEIATGVTYTDEVVVAAGTGTPKALFQYVDVTGNTYSSAYVVSPLTANVQVSFTEITSTYVRRTFTGNTQTLGAISTEAITEGEFFLQRL